MSAVFPETFSPTCSHYSSVAKIIFTSVELRDWFPEFTSDLSHHCISLSTGTWLSWMHGASHMEPTWFYKQSSHFTVLDSRCYLNQLYPPVSLHVSYCLLNPSFIISKQICAGWEQMLWHNLTWNNSYKLMLLLLLFYYRDLWFVVRNLAFKITLTVLNL